ncbi:serine hydrolase domain-containing protein [Reyranella sp.]|uniref:serine hydrolase domain-containing protein n=1 Tax=Reyranella sp. TaxID=1929291 RepID=UPI003D0AA98C
MAALLVAGLVGLASVAWADDPLPRAKPEEVGLSSERLARIATFAKAEIDAGQIPGAVVAVARRGKLVYFEAFGLSDKKAGTPMTTDTIFSLASMTKPMTTVAALQLYEQGRLLIDDPLAKYFPKFAEMKAAVWDDLSKGVRDTAPAARQITIQDLMRHTSGLSYGGSGTSMLHKQYAPSSNGAARTLTSQELMDKMTALPLAHQPGTVWEYSFGLDVLGFVVEKITQKSLGETLQEMVWKPLGMADTGFVVPADKAGRYARGIQDIPSPLVPTKFECGGGCAVGTTGDYLRFASMLLNRGKLGDTRLLGRKTVEYMTANQLAPGTRSQLRTLYADWGFGLSVAVRTTEGIARDSGSVGTFSWPGGYGTYWWADPKEELVAVWMAPTPVGPTNLRYRHTINALVNQAIVD